MIMRRSIGTAGAPQIYLDKSRGSGSSESAVQSGDVTGQLFFRGYDGSGYQSTAIIIGVVDGTPGSGDMPGRLEFYTTPDGSASPTERMRIDSAGNIRFNSTLLVQSLSTSDGSDNGVLNLSGGGAGGWSRGANIFLYGNEASSTGVLDLQAGNVSGGYVVASAGGAERMRITSAGNVGIGTSSPGQRLHVYGSAPRVLSESSGNSDGIFAAKTTSGEWLFGSGIGTASNVFNIFQQTGTSAERFRLDANGLITGSGTSLGAWTAYTPTLGGTGWAIGNGTRNGWYCQIGKIIHFFTEVTFGSTSTYGAGALTISAPVSILRGPSFVALGFDASLATRHSLFTVGNGANIEMYQGNGNTAVTGTVPFTWATSDIIRITGTYEIA